MTSKIQIKVDNQILIVRFKSKSHMNQILDSLSNEYEGILKNREGHNFPSTFIPIKSHFLSPYKKSCAYVIGSYNSGGLAHELLHAKYYVNSNYRESINKEWAELSGKTRACITQFLKSLGYADKVIIDEYQAYRYSEPENFFGIKF
jgi:hypothetical protein